MLVTKQLTVLMVVNCLVINILQNNLFYVKEIHTQQYEGE